jgi:hypothetical protein
MTDINNRVAEAMRIECATLPGRPSPVQLGYARYARAEGGRRNSRADFAPSI